MEPIYLLDLASRKAAWLSAREAVVAGNVANANTPGFRPKDISPFREILAQTQLTLVSTNGSHLEPAGVNGLEAREVTDETNNFDVTESGNGVGVEDEMTKAGEINRDYALTTNIVRSFHSMLMSSLKE